MIVAFSGSRIESQARFYRVDDVLKRLPKDTVVHVGDCPTGTDAHVAYHCKKYGLQCVVFRADWRTHGRKAGPLRNGRMLTDCEVLYAFPCDPGEGESRGTRDAIRQAEVLGLRVVIA